MKQSKPEPEPGSEAGYLALRRGLTGPFCPRCGTVIRYREARCSCCNWPWPDIRPNPQKQGK